jgi:hypothetical protein
MDFDVKDRDQNEAFITTPGLVGSGGVTQYDWNITSTASPLTNNREHFACGDGALARLEVELLAIDDLRVGFGVHAGRSKCLEMTGGELEKPCEGSFFLCTG